MKKLNLALGVVLSVGTFSSCHTGNPVSNGKDTAKNSYHVTPDSSKLDTSKVSPGDATSEDNSASGGTTITKDTTHKDTGKKK